jgi:hypothetical protein
VTLAALRRTGLAPLFPHGLTEPPEPLATALTYHQVWRDAWPPVTRRTPTSWHRHTGCNHRQYNLTCEQLDELLDMAGHACQRCRTCTEPLWIDHDHALGMWGVRGLLCPLCNSHLGQVDTGRKPMDELTFRYLLTPYPYRRPFAQAPWLPLQSVIRRWEDANGVPQHLKIGWASVHSCNVAIRRALRGQRTA